MEDQEIDCTLKLIFDLFRSMFPLALPLNRRTTEESSLGVNRQVRGSGL